MFKRGRVNTLTQKLEDYDNVKDSFVKTEENLEKQITNIEYKQTELQNYMTTIENSISHMEQMVDKEQQTANPSFDRIRGLRTAIVKNVELITKLYDTYKEFESVKFRYHKELSDNNYRKQRLIELELKKMDDRSNSLGQEFYNIMRNLAGLQKNDSIDQELLEQASVPLNDETYQL